ncbi:hypothetical protein QE452_002744 [Sphingomonas sp. SORGH_AS438]|nr:hypothetical protein [Sphingomonas sp. SORGH_AS_0438]
MRLVPFDMVGSQADDQLGAERGLAQLGMRQPQIIPPFGDMVGEFVRQAEAQPVRLPVRPDQVDAGQLRLLAAILGEAGHGQRLARPDQLRAVALVEPFRLLPDRARRRLAALDTRQKHAHRIGLGRGRRRVAMHLVAPLGRAEMGQAGAGHDQMRRIVMVDRRDQPRLLRRQVEGRALATGRHRTRQVLPGGDRALGQFADRGDTRHDMGRVAPCGDHRSRTIGATMLQESKGHAVALHRLALLV